MTYHSKNKILTTKERNLLIFQDFLKGVPLKQTTDKYNLSASAVCGVIKIFKIVLNLSEKNKYYFVSQPDKHEKWIEKVKNHGF